MKNLKIVISAILLFAVLAGIGYAFTPPPPPPPPVPQNLAINDTSIDKLQTIDGANANQSACRACHQSTGTNISGGYNNTLGGVDNRHHGMVQRAVINPFTNVPFGCQDCHPTMPGVGNGVLLDHSCTDCHNGTNFWADASLGARVGNFSRPHHVNTTYDDANIGNPAADRQCNKCHGSFVDNYNDSHYVPSYATSFMITPYATWKATNLSQNLTQVLFDSTNNQDLNKVWGGCESCHLGLMNNTGFGPSVTSVPIGTNHNNHHREILGGNVTTNGVVTNVGVSTPFNNVVNRCTVCHVIDYTNSTGHGNTFPLRFSITDGGTGLTDTNAMEVRNSTIEQADFAIGAVEPGTVNVSINGTGCEKCHSVASIHNIQFNYVQNGQQGLGHINNNADCYGCHNSWLPADTWNPGPLVPVVTDVSPAVIAANTATTLTLTGVNFINPDGNYTSVVTVGGVTYTPSSETQTQIVVNIPALTVGTYQLQLVKGGTVLSNLETLNVVNNPTISSVTFTPGRNGQPGTLVISGSRFGVKPATNANLYVTVNHAGKQIPVSTISAWKDTSISAKISGVASGDQTTVLTTLTGEASAPIN
jgi:hypothetical protein